MYSRVSASPGRASKRAVGTGEKPTAAESRTLICILCVRAHHQVMRILCEHRYCIRRVSLISVNIFKQEINA